ncbi:hypothetical protein [Paracoccus sp. S3-43]|uniref:hypothetical protein n=1 Tax=Paracoccus sp. S3-43 TaxID=3030011 RepID=UPI0023AFA68B|nr:hypothetical protein [Paracoccus sp. S3-43]WEF22911.1 hypothetical protein PXD02_08600 [Paracoccus sp. S3-43]
MKQPLMVLMTLLPGMASASSEDAWRDFRADVETACLALTDAPDTPSVTVEVNPFGSESYGAAVLTVTQDTGTDRMICIFNKQTRATEITAPFADAAPAE